MSSGAQSGSRWSVQAGGGRGDYFPSNRLQIRRWCKQTYQATHITDWVSQLGEVTWYFGVWVFCSVGQCGGGTKADGQQKLKISITGVVAKLLYIYTWKSTCCSLVPLVSSDNPRDWNLEESRQAPFGHEFAGNVFTCFDTTGALQGSSGSVKGKILNAVSYDLWNRAIVLVSLHLQKNTRGVAHERDTSTDPGLRREHFGDPLAHYRAILPFSQKVW